MKYVIIEQESKHLFASLVNEYLKKGYELQGGCSVTVNNHFEITYHQAMIKKEKDNQL